MATIIGHVMNVARSTIDDYGRLADLERQRADVTETLKEAELSVKPPPRLTLSHRIGIVDAYAAVQAERWKARERLGAVTEIRQAFEGLSGSSPGRTSRTMPHRT